MNTKAALAKLSKGEKVYESNSLGQTLSDKSAEYLEQYAAADRRILQKQQTEEVSMPFLQSLRQKVATLTAAQDENLTVVTRFDLYTGIRKISERAQKDIGLKRLTAQLEKAWHEEPMGGLTYGQVKNLVRSFKDTFPRSQAHNAIEAECARVGLHKLPVAKLARIASKINSQADYELAVVDGKFDGDKIEQVRARTLIRSLVSMRTNKTAQEAIGDSLSGLDDVSGMGAGGDLDEAMFLLEEAAGHAEQIVSLVDEASVDAFDNGMDSTGTQLQSLSQQLDQWMSGLTDARTSLVPAPDMQAPAGPTPEAPPAPLSTEEQQDVEDAGLGKSKPKKTLTPEEQDVEDAGMGKSKPKAPKAPEPEVDELNTPKKKKTLDPRTWFASHGAGTIRLARSASKAADLFEGEMGNDLIKLANALNAIVGQLAPMKEMPMEDDDMDFDIDLDMSLEENMPGEMGLDPMDDLGDGAVQAPELDMGMNVLEEIEQAADEIIEQAPPQAVDYIQHEMGEGHMAPPGTAEWGAEEILNEGHEFAPPTEGWLQEEEQELGLNPGGNDMPMPDDLGAMSGKKGPTPMPMSSPGSPGKMGASVETPEQAVVAAWKAHKQAAAEKSKGGKGIPLPKGKIKQQQEVTTYAKKVSPDGGKTLKASDIEVKLLDGKTLKMGDVSIRITANDEVELWESKDAGRACSLMDLDIAIADFMTMTGMKTAQAAPPAAPAAGGAPQPNGPTLTATDIQAALQHYKSMGMGPVDAISMLKKDYKERAELETPEMQTQILGTASGLWTSGAPAAAPGVEGAPAGAPPELPAPVSMAASAKDAQSKMKTPSIRKPKDHIQVGANPLGEDSQGLDLLPSPGKINQSQGKPQGKFSPTDLGEDSSVKDLLPTPGAISQTHSPTDQAGTALPDTDLGRDSESADPFTTPAITKNH